MVLGGDERHRPTNTWWGRNMVCLSADQFAENLLESNGADVKRSKLEGQNWNFEREMDSGIPGPPLTSRPDEGIPTATTQGKMLTVLPPAPPPEDHLPEMRAQGVHAYQSLLVTYRQDSWMPGMRFSRSGDHTLASANRIKMSGTRAAEQHQRRRRNVELLKILIHDRWTRVEVRWIPSRRGQI